MKRLLAGIPLALAAITLRADDAGDLEEKTRRLSALVAELDSPRAEAREEAATRLLAAGADAIPFVLDGVYRKNAKLHLQVLEKLIAQERKGLPAELRMTDQELKAVVKDRLGDPKAAPVRTWLYSKYLEAVDLYRQRHFEEAIAKAGAILELDPRVEFAGDVKLLRVKCEEELVQVHLVRLSAVTMTPVVGDNTVVKVAFNATNMSTGNVEIWFGPPAERNNQPVRDAVIENQSVIQVEMVTSVCEPDGSSSSETELSVKPLRRYSIQVPQGETVRLFEMEIPAMTSGIKLVKIFVNAKLRVVQVDGPEPLLKERSLSFQSAEIRVVPGDIQAAAGNALQNLCNAIDRGQPDSTYLFCNVMPEKDRPQAVEVLMNLLRASKANDYDRRVARNCLRTLTGEAFMDDEGWIRWQDELRKAAAAGGGTGR